MQNQAENLNNSGSSGNSTSGIDIAKIIARAKDVISNPKGVWPSIKAEPLSTKDIYMQYLLLLAAIGPVCGFIGLQLFGLRLPFIGTWRPPFFASLSQHVLTYALTLGAAYLFAFIAEKIAPKFGGSTDTNTCLKLIVFSAIPAYLAGFLSLIPWLGLIGGLISLYSVYILWQGVPVMTGVPEAKRLPYFAVIMVSGFVAALIIALLLAPFMASTAPDLGSIQGGAGDIDLKQLENGMKQLEKLMPNAK